MLPQGNYFQRTGRFCFLDLYGFNGFVFLLRLALTLQSFRFALRQDITSGLYCEEYIRFIFSHSLILTKSFAF